jgi:hypothetical protein
MGCTSYSQYPRVGARHAVPVCIVSLAGFAHFVRLAPTCARTILCSASAPRVRVFCSAFDFQLLIEAPDSVGTVNLFSYASTCAKNRGAFLNFVACSKLCASLIRTGSLHARPKNEIPTGKPKSNPAVTLIFG